MIPSIARDAVKIKCKFENAKMVGNYECAYALGVLNASLGMEKVTDYKDIADLKQKIYAHAADFTTENKNLQQMYKILTDYEPGKVFDEQMRELFDMGFADKSWE